jgi:hypothetical protein
MNRLFYSCKTRDKSIKIRKIQTVNIDEKTISHIAPPKTDKTTIQELIITLAILDALVNKELSYDLPNILLHNTILPLLNNIAGGSVSMGIYKLVCVDLDNSPASTISQIEAVICLSIAFAILVLKISIDAFGPRLKN